MAELTEVECGDAGVPAATQSSVVKDKTAKTGASSKSGEKQKNAGKRKTKKNNRPKGIKGSGVIFIKHLPKGFNEEELRQFFQQFGDIVRVCVARSKKTQESKGYGYVHFRFHEVAVIAASAVNNYMMFGRILKAMALPKQMTRLPRNFTRAFNSKGEQRGAYRQWMQKRIRDSNSYLGEQSVCEKFSKQMKRLKRAEKELSEAGIEVPETINYVAQLKAKTSGLKEQIKEKLAKRAASGKKTKRNVVKKGKNDNDDEEEEDEDEAFSPLQPTDWKEVESTANETEETEEMAEANKKEAIEKAQEKGKEFALANKKTDKPATVSNKENKRAAPAGTKQSKKAKELITTSNEESKKVSPVKKEPKTAKLTLSKKKQSEKTSVPSLKIKGKPAAKGVKSVKLDRMVK